MEPERYNLIKQLSEQTDRPFETVRKWLQQGYTPDEVIMHSKRARRPSDTATRLAKVTNRHRTLINRWLKKGMTPEQVIEHSKTARRFITRKSDV